MLAKRIITRNSLSHLKPKQFALTPKLTSIQSPSRSFSVSSLHRMADGAPPKHEMVHFKGLASEKRAFGDFRRVLHTGLYSQVVVMEIPVNGDIGDEVHTVDQVLIFNSGKARAEVAGKKQEVNAGDVVVVPAGTQHQFWNTGSEPLELVTIYSPAEHATKSVHKTKEQGDKEEEDEIDVAPEWSRKPKAENEKAGLVKEDGGPYKE